MKVYLLWSGEQYEGPWLNAVFTNEAKAFEARDEKEKAERAGDDHFFYYVTEEETIE